jgi:hypothetical protein
MTEYHAGDIVEMLVAGRIVDRGRIVSLVDNRDTDVQILTIDWQNSGRLTQMLGELRKKAAPVSGR